MASYQVLLAFLANTVAFAFLPGPAMLYAAAQTLAQGRLSGLLAAFGLHLGGYVHILAAAAGLSMLLHAMPLLYTFIKLLGALYLIWLGLRMMRRQAGIAQMPMTEPKTARRALAESIMVEALNPKTAIFFLAFLPQFIDPAGSLPVWGQILILGAVVNGMCSTAEIGGVLLAGALSSRLRRSGCTWVAMQWTGGLLIVGLGVNMALQRS